MIEPFQFNFLFFPGLYVCVIGFAASGNALILFTFATALSGFGLVLLSKISFGAAGSSLLLVRRIKMRCREDRTAQGLPISISRWKLRFSKDPDVGWAD